MTANQVRAEVDRFTLALLQNALAIDTNRTIRRNGYGQDWVTWASMPEMGSPLYEAPTFGEYMRLVKERQYTALLADYSMLQLSFSFHRESLATHRLCFYPCPVAVDQADAASFGIVDYLEALSPIELVDRIKMEGPIRIDFDPASSKEGHAAAHLTVHRDGCRIPVFGPLSPGHFIRFVFTHFYRDWWNAYNFIREWPIVWSARTVTGEEQALCYLEWKQPLAEKVKRVFRRVR